MVKNSSKLLVFSGLASIKLAKEAADIAGFSFKDAKIERFPDQEISVRLGDDVQGKIVFLVQSIALKPSEYLLELLFLADAAKRGGASRIIAVIPYFGYSRQDRLDQKGTSISAKVVVDCLEASGIQEVITITLHSEQIEGFFSIPVKNLQTVSFFKEAIFSHSMQNCVVVAPDIGSIKIARNLADTLKLDFAVVDKRRKGADVVEVLSIIGDIKGKNVLLADDVISTGGTLVSAAKACQEKGANMIYGVVTHGLFVGNAIEKIEQSPIKTLWISDTIQWKKEKEVSSKISFISLAPLLASAMQNFHD